MADALEHIRLDEAEIPETFESLEDVRVCFYRVANNIFRTAYVYYDEISMIDHPADSNQNPRAQKDRS